MTRPDTDPLATRDDVARGAARLALSADDALVEALVPMVASLRALATRVRAALEAADDELTDTASGEGR